MSLEILKKGAFIWKDMSTKKIMYQMKHGEDLNNIRNWECCVDIKYNNVLRVICLMHT